MTEGRENSYFNVSRTEPKIAALLSEKNLSDREGARTEGTPQKQVVKLRVQSSALDTLISATRASVANRSIHQSPY